MRNIEIKRSREGEREAHHPDYISFLNVYNVHTCTPFHNLIKELSFSLSISIFDSDNFFSLHTHTHANGFFVIAQCTASALLVHSFNYFTYQFVCMYGTNVCMPLLQFLCAVCFCERKKYCNSTTCPKWVWVYNFFVCMSFIVDMQYSLKWK